MGRNYYVVKKKPTIAEPMHIGKGSFGWKFLFHEIRRGCSEFDDELEIHTFNQWKKWLEKNVGYKDDRDYTILDEYDDHVPLKELMDLVEEKQGCNNPEDFKHNQNVDGYRFREGYFT